MTQYPLIPFFNMIQPDLRASPHRETESEIFARIATTMREDQRRDRRNRTYARLRRIFGGGRGTAPGSRRVAHTH